jgi:hypothetical protein
MERFAGDLLFQHEVALNIVTSAISEKIISHAAHLRVIPIVFA